MTVGTSSGQPHCFVAVSYLRQAGTTHVVQSSPVTVTVGQPPVSVGSSPGGLEGGPVGIVSVKEGMSPVGVSPGGMLTSPPPVGVSPPGMLTSPLGISPPGLLTLPSASCATAEPALWGC